MGQELFVAITKDDEVYSIDFDMICMKQCKKIFFSFIGYRECITDVEGEEKAREQLSSQSYWEDIGYINKDMPQVLIKNIDFEAVAEEVINTDGWEMTLGEYQEFGEYETDNYFMDVCSSSHDIPDDVKVWLIPKSVIDELIEHRSNGKDKTFEQRIERIQEILDTYSAMLNRETVIRIYKETEFIETEKVMDFLAWHFDEKYMFSEQKLK